MIINKTYEQRVREAELKELRRLQRLRAIVRSAEKGGAAALAAETEGSSSDESEGDYLKVSNEFAAKGEAAKWRAAENVRRSLKAN